MFRRLLASWEAQHTRPARPARRLRLESLEAREVPTVALAAIPDQQIANNAPTFLPLTVTNTPSGTVSYDVTSSDAAVTPSILQGGRSVRFTVTGRNPDGTTFTGDMTIRLFESAAPNTTARLIQLVNQGFYINKLFHRVERTFGAVDETIIQGGSLNGDGTGGSGLGELADEYDADFRFNSPGIVASANRGDDTTDNQFFIDRPTTVLANRPQFLNFNYTVFGILTEGADIYERVRNTPLNGTRPATNVTITAATVFADNENAVVRLAAQPGYAGTARLTVTPRDNDGTSPAVAANLTGTTSNPTTGNAPFLGALPATLTTAAGDPITFSVPTTDVDGSPVTIAVRDATFTSPPANVTVSINQAAGTVTLTPAAGFTGNINLRVGVRDNIDRNGGGNLDGAANFDTQPLLLTVTAASSAPQATVALSASTTTPTTTQPVTLTANVAATGVANPAGTVEFRNGTTLLAVAAVTNGVASVVQTFNSAGVQSVTATFVPTNAAVVRGNTSAPVVLTVTADVVVPTPPAASTITLTAPPTATAGTAISVSAAVGSSVSPLAGTVRFLSDGATVATAPLANGTAAATVTLAQGTRSLTAVFDPADATVVASSTSAASAVVVSASSNNGSDNNSNNGGSNNGSTTPGGITAQGGRPGNEPRVTVFNADGTTRVSFLAFEAGFTGGVRTAVADVTGDGAPDIVVVPGFGGGPVIKVFNSDTGELISSNLVMEEAFRGGLNLATGDTSGLGYSRILVGAGQTGAPRVVLFDARTKTTVLDFVAYDANLRSGVSVSLGLLPGGRGADIVTGAGVGGGPQVNVYDGAGGKLLGSRFAGDAGERLGVGVRVAAVAGSATNTVLTNRQFGGAATAEDPIGDLGFVDFKLADAKDS